MKHRRSGMKVQKMLVFRKSIHPNAKVRWGDLSPEVKRSISVDVAVSVIVLGSLLTKMQSDEHGRPVLSKCKLKTEMNGY